MSQAVIVRSVSALTSALRNGSSAPLRIKFLEDYHADISLLQGIQLALALSHSIRTSSLYVRCSSSEILLVICEAMKHNTTLQSCSIDFTDTKVSDETGAAMAEALKVNTSLQSCSIDLGGTEVSDETGAAMAEALKVNTSLQSCSIDLYGTEAGDETNSGLETVYSHVMSRNSTLLALRRVLMQLARRDDSMGFQSLKSGSFRNTILDFFVPRACNFQTLGPERADLSSMGSSLGKPLPQTASVAGIDAHEESHSEPDKEVQLDHALVASMAEASERENSDLAAAIVRSKADAMPAVNLHGVVLLRLTRCARTPQVVDAITTSADLADCRAVVAEAGCELRPKWAGGAWILLPMTPGQFEESALELGEVHILVLDRDEDAVRKALRSVDKNRRPKIRAEVIEAHGASASRWAIDGSSSIDRSLPSVPDDCASEDMDVVVERTFIHFPLPREAPTSYSAPF